MAFDNSSSMEQKEITTRKFPIPEPTVRRIPWYLSYVSYLNSKNIDYVSSTAISKEINVDASQIAKDLSYLNIKGKTRIGYEVKSLEVKLRDFLGFNKRHPALLIGVGSLGAALISDSGLKRYGLDIVAGFDINPQLIGKKISNVPIYGMTQLASIRKNLKTEIGVITVPPEVAQTVADSLVKIGIKALWNFTPIRIRPYEGVVIQNTSIYADLAVMYNCVDGNK